MIDYDSISFSLGSRDVLVFGGKIEKRCRMYVAFYMSRRLVVRIRSVLDFFRHWLEELHLCKKRYPKGEPYYTSLSARIYFLAHPHLWKDVSIRWFLTGIKK